MIVRHVSIRHSHGRCDACVVFCRCTVMAARTVSATAAASSAPPDIAQAQGTTSHVAMTRMLMAFTCLCGIAGALMAILSMVIRGQHLMHLIGVQAAYICSLAVILWRMAAVVRRALRTPSTSAFQVHNSHFECGFREIGAYRWACTCAHRFGCPSAQPSECSRDSFL